MHDPHSPRQSLQTGTWFKLICGASFQDLPSIRSLVIAYGLAGADCIDLAADPAVVQATLSGLEQVRRLAPQARSLGFQPQHRPWLMVSLTVGEDPHFRKAAFDARCCPGDCPRPCQRVCPADAIAFEQEPEGVSGVLEQRCYGCGRCLSLCPLGLIETYSQITPLSAIAPSIEALGIDAIEIHTQVGPLGPFLQLWQALVPWLDKLKLVAISCGERPGLINYLRSIDDLIAPLPCPLLWQTDGRPMSGDIGKGTTHAAIALAQKVLQAKLSGYVQLAGGTNEHTVTKLRHLGRLNPQTFGLQHPADSPNVAPPLLSPCLSPQPTIAGVAYGSFARRLLTPILLELDTLNQQRMTAHLAPLGLEQRPALLWQAVRQASALVAQLKPHAMSVPPTTPPHTACP